jgi:hypothetical protein
LPPHVTAILTVAVRPGFAVPVREAPFITAMAAEDRCHLNGLAMLDGQPRYVTVLAESDAPQGWRRPPRPPCATFPAYTPEMPSA